MLNERLRTDINTIGDVINLSRYPLQDSDVRSELVSHCRRQLEKDHIAILPDFITAGAIDAICKEADAAFGQAYRRKNYMQCAYGPESLKEDWPADHPRKRVHRSAQWIIAADFFSQSGALQRLFKNEAFVEFLREALNKKTLYPVEDPLLNIVVTAIGDGDEHAWHFDQNEYAVTLLLQKPEAGGLFEYAPGIRNAKDENYPGVARVMDGDKTLTKHTDVDAGTLVLFRGNESVHRVSPVSGKRLRLIAVLSYHDAPGFNYSEGIRQAAVGRSQPRPAAAT